MTGRGKAIKRSKAHGVGKGKGKGVSTKKARVDNGGKGKGKGNSDSGEEEEASSGEEDEEASSGEEEEEEEAAGAAIKKLDMGSGGKRKGKGKGADVAAGPVVPIISADPDEITSQNGPKRILYDLPVDFEEPLGTKLVKKWGRKMYHGILIEKFSGDKGEGDYKGDYRGRFYRGIYQDGKVHDFPLDKTRDAVNNAHSPAVSPDITLEIYDPSVAADKMGDVVSEDGDGNFTIRYKPSGDGVDSEDPLSMGLATRSEDGKSILVGMAMARITGENPIGVKAPVEYRVLFENGKGSVVTPDQVKKMRKLFLETPGLEPAVVVVRGVNMV